MHSAPCAVELDEPSSSTDVWQVACYGLDEARGQWVSLGAPITTLAPAGTRPGRRLVALALVPGFRVYQAIASTTGTGAGALVRLVAWPGPVPSGSVAGLLNLDNPPTPAAGPAGPPGPPGVPGTPGAPGAPGQSAFVWGSTTLTTTTATRYLDVGTGLAAGTVIRQWRAPVAGTLRNLFFSARVAGAGGGTISYRLLINGVPVLTLTTTALTTAASLLGSVAVAQGDLVALECIKSAVLTTSPTDVAVTTSFEAP